jgi:Uma2 family endonuclease
VRDLLGITRALYRAELAADLPLAQSRCDQLAEIGKQYRLSLELAESGPGTMPRHLSLAPAERRHLVTSATGERRRERAALEGWRRVRRAPRPERLDRCTRSVKMRTNQIVNASGQKNRVATRRSATWPDRVLGAAARARVIFRGMAQAADDPCRALYERYQAVPQPQRAEIINGTLYVLPRPAPPHANAASVLGGELNGSFQRGRGGPGGWWILDEPELHLTALEPVAPDLAGWRVERMPSLPETAYFTLAPDWICEILSKSTECIDRDEKLPLYAAHGVQHVWLVDPIGKTLEVRTLGTMGRWREVQIHQGNAPVRAAPFEAIDLAALWSPPRVV